MTSQSNDGDGGDDDNAVHEHRPRPRLTFTNPRPTREVCQCGERQPERAKGDQHGSCHGGAHREPELMAKALSAALVEELDALGKLAPDKLRAQREERFLRIGEG